MRVVAGEARGRRLLAPAGRETRPTADRVREAVFNALGSLGAVDGARVLDLFGGSGALAIEALSRGAARATIVEHDRIARTAIEANLVVTGLAEQAEVVAGDAIAHLAHLAAAAARFELVLLDPPYPFEPWADLLASVASVLAPGGIVLIESDREVPVAPHVDILRTKRYGSTVVVIGRAPADETAPSGEHE